MKVLVCAEARQNQLDRLFFELVTAARSVADSGEVVALWIGADEKAARDQMGSADRVLVAADPRFVSATADIYATVLHRAIEAEKPEHLLGPVQGLAVCSVYGAASGLSQPLCFREISFAASEVLLRPFALFDIYVCAVPFDDFSIFVEAWSCTEQKPTVFFVETAQPCLELTWPTRG